MAVKAPATRTILSRGTSVAADTVSGVTAGDTIYAPYQNLLFALGYTTSGTIQAFVCSHVAGVSGAGAIVTIGSGPSNQSVRILYIGQGA